MRRILVIHCPSVRSTAGSSFGPMKMSATTPMMTSLPQLMSNIEFTVHCLRKLRGRSSTCAHSRESGIPVLSKAGSPLSRGRADEIGPGDRRRSGSRAFDALLGVGARLHRRPGVLVVDHLHAVRLG